MMDVRLRSAKAVRHRQRHPSFRCDTDPTYIRWSSRSLACSWEWRLFRVGLMSRKVSIDQRGERRGQLKVLLAIAEIFGS